MPDEIPLTRGAPETVLPDPAQEMLMALETARGVAPERRRDALAEVAAGWPRVPDVWAELAELEGPEIDRYAFARVGYHRGLDALRAAGWRGNGYVRWDHPSNRGFLRSLDALRASAEVIGEADEADRCRVFLRQLDPRWPPPERR